MSANTFVKDPNATLDFGFDWSQWLDTGEAITGYVITAASGLTVVTHTSTSSGSVIVWISGGSASSRYTLACEITTDSGRIDERTMKIDVKQR